MDLSALPVMLSTVGPKPFASANEKDGEEEEEESASKPADTSKVDDEEA